MICKMVEIRDRGTFIPALAVKLEPAYDWTNNTMRSAHAWLIMNFDSIRSGQVVDVEFILGHTQAPKKSEAEE